MKVKKRAMRRKPARRKKIRTGNGTSAIQWLYVLWNFPFVWVCKIGIGGKLKERERQVDASAPGWDLIIFALPIPMAYQVEQFIHRMCAPLRVKFWGSGYTERFFVLAIVPAIAIATAWAALSYGSIALLVFTLLKSI